MTLTEAKDIAYDLILDHGQHVDRLTIVEALAEFEDVDIPDADDVTTVADLIAGAVVTVEFEPDSPADCA